MLGTGPNKSKHLSKNEGIVNIATGNFAHWTQLTSLWLKTLNHAIHIIQLVVVKLPDRELPYRWV